MMENGCSSHQKLIIGVHPHFLLMIQHPMSIGFSTLNQPFWDTPMEKSPSFHGPRPRPRQVDHPNHPANKSPRTSGTLFVRFVVGRGSSTPVFFKEKGMKRANKLGGNLEKPLEKWSSKPKTLGKQAGKIIGMTGKQMFLTWNCILCISILGNARFEAAKSAFQSTCGCRFINEEPHSHPQIAGFDR